MEISEIKVSYSPKVAASERPSVKCAEDALNVFRGNWEGMEYHESFKVLLLNRANKVLGIYEVSKGGIHGTMADPKMIFGAALKGAACSIITAHNHPSGNKYPSEADKQLAKKLNQGAKLLDMAVLDHLILTPDEEIYYSFAEMGEMYS